MSKVTNNPTGKASTVKRTTGKTATNGTKTINASTGKATNGKEKAPKSTGTAAAKTGATQKSANQQQNDFISVADENDLQQPTRSKSGRSQKSRSNNERSSRLSSTTDRESANQGDTDAQIRARQEMSNLEQNARNADADFDAEYEDFKSKNSDSLNLLCSARTTLDEQAEALEEASFEQIFFEVNLVQALRDDISSTRRLLMAAEQYTRKDFMSELASLRTSLRRCVEIFRRKITLIPVKADNRPTVKLNAEALKQIAAASVDFKELERLVLDIIQASQELVEELQKNSAEMEELQELMEYSQEKALEMQETDEEGDQDNEENNEEDEEPADDKEPEETEEERRKREEQELALMRQEEEERERRRKAAAEEEERLRLEREIEEKRKNEDPKNFPAIVYELDAEDDNTGCGVACIVRAPPSVNLDKSQLNVTSLDMVTNRYQPGDNEELVSNIIYVQPQTTEDLKFELPVWMAVPCSGTSRGKELSIRVRYARCPREERKHSALSQRNEQWLAQNQDTNIVVSQDESEAKDNGEPLENNPAEEEKTEENDQGDKNVDEADKKDEDSKTDQSPSEKELAEIPEKLEKPSRTNSRISLKQEVEQKNIEEEEEEEEEPAWEDVLTRETTVEGQESIKFVETMFEHIPAYGFQILIVIRPKKETGRFISKGGKLIYSLDARNSIIIPEEAFRLADVTMQVITVDSSVMNGLRERYEGCDLLIGSSPFINISLPVKPSKALTFTVANPSGGNRPRRATDKTGGHAGSKVSLPSLTKSRQVEETSTDMDIVSLMTKDSNGKWKHCNDAKITPSKDLTTFKSASLFERLVLLRTSGAVDSNDLCKIVAKLETALLERTVSVVVRQSVSELEKVILELSRTENLEKVLQRLTDDDYAEGPEVDELICLQEGDLIEVSFRENIHFDDKKSRRIVFNSNLQSGKLTSTISTVDEFSQNALENYRGYIQLSLVDKHYRAPPKISNLKKPKNVGPGFMCEIALMLPKPVKEILRINKARVHIQTEGPISEEYFNQLSDELGEEWLNVAAGLGHSLASIQRIQQTFAHLAGTADGHRKCVKTMLVDWYKASNKSKHKVDDLYNALIEGRRNDLAEELLQNDKKLRDEFVRKEREELLEKCSRAYSESSAARRNWRPVAKALGLTSDDIVTVGGTPLVQELSMEQAREMLTRWQNLKGETATKDSLVVALRKLKLNEAAANVSLVR